MTDKEHSITALRPAWLDEDWRASETIFAAGSFFFLVHKSNLEGLKKHNALSLHCITLLSPLGVHFLSNKGI